MSTLFVERSGACVGEESLIDEHAFVKVSAALPEESRARLRWVVGYVGNRLLAPEEIRDMAAWMDLFGHAREVGLDMKQIRAFIDSARGERFLQKHEVHAISANGDSDFGSGKTRRALELHGSNGHSKSGRAKKVRATEAAVPEKSSHSELRGNGHTSRAIKIGSPVHDLDRRRKRSGRIVEVRQTHAKIEWESGRVNEISLDRLLSPRLFTLQ